MKAVSFIPTGRLSNAEIKAMCSFPLPDAIDNATSKLLESSFFSFSWTCCLNWNKSAVVSTSITETLELEKGFGVFLSLTRRIFSQSILLIRAVTWP